MRKVAIGIVLYLIWFGFALFMQEAIIKDYQPMPQQEGYEYIRKDNVGYYPSLETALKGCLHKILLEEVQEKTMTLKEVIEVIEKFHSSIREYLNGQ